MKITYCDICGKKLEPLEIYGSGWKGESENAITIQKTWVPPSITKYDVCHGCLNKVSEFIKKLKEVKQ